MPETQYITVFSYGGEDKEGEAQYRVRVYEGIYEEHAAREEERDGLPRACYISGFLFPHASEYGEVCVSVGRDLICAGDVSHHQTPKEAAACGHTVYRLKSAAQPPRFSDGMLSDWCHFEAKTPRGQYT